MVIIRIFSDDILIVVFLLCGLLLLSSFKIFQDGDERGKQTLLSYVFTLFSSYILAPTHTFC